MCRNCARCRTSSFTPRGRWARRPPIIRRLSSITPPRGCARWRALPRCAARFSPPARGTERRSATLQSDSPIHRASRWRTRDKRASSMAPMLPANNEPSSTARRDRRNTLAAFRPLGTKSASAGSNTSSKPASACSIRDDTMHTSQSPKRDACRSIRTGRNLAPERSV